MVRSHAAGEVRAAGDRGLPLRDDRREQLVVAGLDRDVDGTGGEVQRPHGVTAEHGRLADRHVVLEVRLAEADLAERAPAAPVDEQRGLVEVALLTRHAGQLDQAQLDLGVTADALDPAGTERRAHVVGGAARDLDERVVARRPRSRDAGLEQVAEVVQLVAPLEVAVARLLARSPEHRVEVAVGLLRRRR